MKVILSFLRFYNWIVLFPSSIFFYMLQKRDDEDGHQRLLSGVIALDSPMASDNRLCNVTPKIFSGVFHNFSFPRFLKVIQYLVWCYFAVLKMYYHLNKQTLCEQDGDHKILSWLILVKNCWTSSFFVQRKQKRVSFLKREPSQALGTRTTFCIPDSFTCTFALSLKSVCVLKKIQEIISTSCNALNGHFK